MKELRPHHNPDSFLAAMDTMQKEGYYLLYLEDDGKIFSVAGFRFTTTLYDGLLLTLMILLPLIVAETKVMEPGFLIIWMILQKKKELKRST